MNVASRTSAWRAHNKALGVCVGCGQNQALDGVKWCARCKERSAVKHSKYHQSWKGLFADIRRTARRRDIAFDITLENFIAARQNAVCIYGGERIVKGGGLDRIDNAKGYSVDNIAPCCSRHNLMKNTFFTFGEMRAILDLFPRLRKCGTLNIGRCE